MKFIVVCCCILALVDYTTGEAEELVRHTDGATYVLAAPGTLLAGSSNRFCLSRLGRATEGTARLHLDIDSENRTQQHHVARLRKNFPPGNGGCFDIVVPKTIHIVVTLHLRIWFEALPSYEVARNWRGVRVISEASLVTVQTDRPLYRAGDTVRFRILHLRPELLPVHTPIRRVWLEMSGAMWGAEHARVAEWQHVRTQLGLAQIEYVLDQYAPKGEWTVHVETDDNGVESAIQSFTVADYTLPTFYITVDHPARVLKTTARITWTVCVRHMWGEGVRGGITTVVHTDGGASPIKLTARLYGQPCHNHTLDLRRLGVGTGSDGPSTIVADVAFQEESTRMWKNTSVISTFVEESIRIEFNKFKMVVSPGLPYKIKIRVTDWAEEPLSSTAVKICRSASNSSGVNDPEENSVDGNMVVTEPCDTIYTDPKGYVQVAFNVPSDLNAKYYRIQATVRSTQANLSLSLRAGDRVHAALGAIGSGGLRNHVPLYISYPPHVVVSAPTVHFMLVTRGGVIYRWGATTQCPQPSTIPLSNRQMSHPSTLCQNPSSSRVLLRTALPARMSHQMCPHSHMLVYFYHGGELIFAVKHFKVSECFYNKVMAHWSPSVVPPGNSTRLIVKSLGPALCATSVRDLALRYSMPSSDEAPTLQNQLLDKLKAFMDMRKNITLRDVPPRSCFAENGISDSAAEYYEYLTSTFSTSGMRILSDVLPELDCSSDQPEPLEQPSNPVPYERSYFPEAWLWDLKLLPSNGTLEIAVKAPDAVTQYETTVTCVSRSGIAVAPMTVLKVFQPFFVELETPKQMKRGEQTQLFYKIFNYINTSLAVTVDIETEFMSGIEIRGAKGSSPTSHTICVGVGDVYSVRLGVLATKVGDWRLAVSAKVLPQMQQYCGSDVAQTFLSDKIVKLITVDPEGEPIEKHHSAMLCTEEEGRYDSELAWSWNVSERTVPGSTRWAIWITGDMTGPLDVNADKLLTLPLGCGEQNMARLAYNLVALRHMELMGQVNQESKEKALANIMSGYSRQITYVHPKGGFSAFGPADDKPSTWLTAFCLRYLHTARQRLSMEGTGHALSAAEDWLVSLQMENGCFHNDGQVFHREFKGGLDSESSNIALTAYILISLIESKTVLRPNVVKSASYCLQALYRSSKPSKNIFTLSLIVYAQSRLARYEVDIQQRNDISLRHPKEYGQFAKLIEPPNSKHNEEDISGSINRESKKEDAIDLSHAMSILRQSARRSGDLVWWEAESLSTSVETTAYAILALLERHNGRKHDTSEDIMRDKFELDDIVSAVRWLSLHRNSAGGFLSTQDTLVALEALAAWSTTTAHSPPELLVSISGTGLEQSVQITPTNRHDLKIFKADAGDVRIQAQGKGCVLVQATQHYNSLQQTNTKIVSPFSLHASLQTDGTFDCQYNATWCRCAAVVEVCVSWASKNFPEMAILDVELPTGYVTDKTLLYKLLARDNILLRRLEESENKRRVVMYLAMSGSYRGGRPRECYKLYLIGPQLKTAPAVVQVYDYYHTEVNASKRYIIPESCPGPTAHNEPARLGSNNIYRSLDDVATGSQNSENSQQSSAEVYPYMLPTSQESNEEIPDIAPPSYKRKQCVDNQESANECENKTTVVRDDEINNVNIKSSDTFEQNIVNKTVYQIPTKDQNKTMDSTIPVRNMPSTVGNVFVPDTPDAKKISSEVNLSTVLSKQSDHHIETEKLYTLINKDHSNLDAIVTEKPNQKLDKTTEDNYNSQEFVNVSANPFSNFHVIDSDMDLDVPEGIEGPIPSIVAPPSNLVWQSVGTGHLPLKPSESMSIKDLPTRRPDCSDRFSNWTVVDHDLIAEDTQHSRTQPALPCKS